MSNELTTNNIQTLPKLRYFTLREWKYLSSVFNIRAGYDGFLPEDVDRAVESIFYFKPDLIFEDLDEKKAFLDKGLYEYSPEEINCLDFDLTKIYMPKFFWKNFKQYLNIDGYIGHKFDENITDTYNAFTNPETHITKFLITTEPREEQLPLFETFNNIKNSVGSVNGILQAAPGVGKTFMSLKLISNHRVRGMIIVPNDVLLKQWIESIKQFSNFTDDDIGILQGSDPEFLSQECKKEVNIIIINSLYSQIKRLGHDFVYSLYKNIGIVFYDETHISGGAESFSKTSCAFLTNNIIGLTATPFRKGLNEFLLDHSIGPVFFKSDHQNLIPTIHIHCNFIQFDQKTLDRLTYFRNDYIRFLTMYNSGLFENDAYFEYLADWVNFRHSQGHNSILIFATNKMIFKMEKVLKRKYNLDSGIIIGNTEKETKKEKDKLTESIKQAIIESYPLVFPKKRKIPELVVGSNLKPSDFKLIDEINVWRLANNLPAIIIVEQAKKLSEMEIAKSKKIIIGNQQMLSAGFDNTMSSCLFVCTPFVGKVVTIQSVGRITRTNPNKIQDIHAHFMWSHVFLQFFPDMHWNLVRNLKVGFPDAKFNLENFPS
jgi:superfamily II DNA or RNA helicase